MKCDPDLLFARGGGTLTKLESELEMSRFGVLKHLRATGLGGRRYAPGHHASLRPYQDPRRQPPYQILETVAAYP